MKSKSIKTENSGVSAIAIIFVAVLLSAVFLLYALLTNTALANILIGLGMSVALFILIYSVRSTSNFSSVAFYIPFILLIIFSIPLVIGGWNGFYFLFACLNFSGIVFLFSNYRKTIQMILTNLLIGILLFMVIPGVEPDIPLTLLVVTWFITLLSTLIIIRIAGSVISGRNEAVEDQNYFKNLLTTTANYFVMVDDSNRVIYISQSLSSLAKIDNPDLARGRLFMDLFQGRDLKLLIGDMLLKKEKFSGAWEFVLDGQKRYFWAISNSLAGSTKDFLINLQDLTSLAERDEITFMKDNLKIGFFFMNREFIIQDHYSMFLEEMLSETGLAGVCFPDFLSASVTEKELVIIRDYFGMIFNNTFDQEILEDINPLNEFYYINKKTRHKKVFHCDFSKVDKEDGEVFILVTIHDVTLSTELQRRLHEEEVKRQEEMQSVFELIQVDSGAFSIFLEDVEYEFERINKALKNDDLSAHQALVGIYQSIHAIKSNAVILGLNTFGTKVHNLESKIKTLQNKKDISFYDMLNLTMEIESLMKEKDGFKVTIDKIKSITKNAGESNVDNKKKKEDDIVKILSQTAEKAASDLEKKVRFTVKEIVPEAFNKGSERIIKEVLMQLVRNSMVHGIETPQERLESGKNETGNISLSIKLLSDGKIHVKLQDDGRGLDYEKIGKKAVAQKLIRKEDQNNKDMLIKAIFMPGFSTADTEGMHAGRGVGLNLVRDRVREMKGSIKINSELGKGTVFNIFIPVNLA